MHSCGLSITRRRTSGAVITRASSADPRHHSPARHCPWRPRVGGESFLANAPSYQLLCARRTLIWPGADVRSCASQPPNDSKPFRAFAITDCSRYISHCVCYCASVCSCTAEFYFNTSLLLLNTYPHLRRQRIKEPFVFLPSSRRALPLSPPGTNTLSTLSAHTHASFTL